LKNRARQSQTSIRQPWSVMTPCDGDGGGGAARWPW